MRENLSLGFPQNELITFVLFFFISHDLNMIDPIYAHYYFSVISHFGSGDRIKVLIFFQLLTRLTFFKQAKS